MLPSKTENSGMEKGDCDDTWNYLQSISVLVVDGWWWLMVVDGGWWWLMSRSSQGGNDSCSRRISVSVRRRRSNDVEIPRLVAGSYLGISKLGKQQKPELSHHSFPWEFRHTGRPQTQFRVGKKIIKHHPVITISKGGIFTITHTIDEIQISNIWRLIKPPSKPHFEPNMFLLNW